jgi:arsenite oxidase small subunit
MTKSCQHKVDLGRRQFLRGSGVVAAASVATAVGATNAKADMPLARVNYPSQKLANVKDLKVDEPTEISYPDADSPGVLIKLGKAVEAGAGPDQDIVAFSTLCPHKGFPLSYVPTDKSLNCPGHYSRFDCEKGGQEIWGHATQNLAQFALHVDDKGDIYATAVDEMIYGRISNVLA